MQFYENLGFWIFASLFILPSFAVWEKTSFLSSWQATDHCWWQCCSLTWCQGRIRICFEFYSVFLLLFLRVSVKWEIPRVFKSCEQFAFFLLLLPVRWANWLPWQKEVLTLGPCTNDYVSSLEGSCSNCPVAIWCHTSWVWPETGHLLAPIPCRSWILSGPFKLAFSGRLHLGQALLSTLRRQSLGARFLLLPFVWFLTVVHVGCSFEHRNYGTERSPNIWAQGVLYSAFQAMTTVHRSFILCLPGIGVTYGNLNDVCQKGGLLLKTVPSGFRI